MSDALRDLPELPLSSWEPTRFQLHLVSQIAGKVRLACAPWQNHWWHATLYLSARGLTTGAIPHGALTFDLEIDLLDHALVLRASDGTRSAVPLEGRPIADVYRESMSRLAEIGCQVSIKPLPYKCKSEVPFPEDRAHAAYDRAAASRAFEVLRRIEPVFREFRGRFTGKSSPVHFFWHSFDLAVTRFSGRRAPALPGADRVTQEAYSHEVSSAGFWFGDDTTPEPAFYSYAAPAPEGLTERPLRPDAARWLDLRGSPMALYRYDDLRRAERPREALLDFLESSYQAASRDWPRVE